ncbi:MAG TPA: twin-arginine translocase TatA/TatE family subunit [Ktedonobacterales bacterium]
MGAFARWDILLPLLVVALLVFGAKRLPEIGSAAGQTIKSFQKAMRDGKDSEGEQQALPPATDETVTPRQ